jgi:hypothetical protein
LNLHVGNEQNQAAGQRENFQPASVCFRQETAGAG